MKKSFCLLVILIMSMHFCQAQWLNGLSVNPVNPTDTDNVQVVVDGTFGSAGCKDWYIYNQMQNGFEYTYFLVNCLGMMSVMCDNNDTINMGILAAGSYKVTINLNRGYLPAPCTPNGQWNADTIYFNVSTTTGIDAAASLHVVTVHPNPLSGNEVMIHVPDGGLMHQPYALSILDIKGRVLKDLDMSGNELKVYIDLPPGIYMIAVTGTRQVFSPAKVVVY